MSTAISTSQRPTGVSTTLRVETILPSILPPRTASLERPFTFIQLDTAAPSPSANTDENDDNSPSATTSIARPTATCSKDSDCASDKVCSKGMCASLVEAAPLGPAGGSEQEQTTHMSTPTAIGVGIGVMALILILSALGFFLVRRRARKVPERSIEAPPTTRDRSASSATDQKTLVASVPNSPQNARFRGQRDEMSPGNFAKLHEPYEGGQEKFAHERQDSSSSAMDRRSISTEKALPMPPNDMPLPPPPVEEKRYAINVNINKSMIFDDFTFASPDPHRDSNTSRERMPKYRFEEYLPPVTRTPRLSISQKTRSSQRTSDYEMGPYPREGSSEDEATTDDEQKAETKLRRGRTLKKLESKPPQLPMPELPPPSPSFSFRSYDWYQDIIGTEKSDTEDSAPTIPGRNPARTPTKATFGAALTSNPSATDASLIPEPLSPSTSTSPAKPSHLHPDSAALPSPMAAEFRLSPTVYTMPSRPPKARPVRTSLQSTATQKTHMSRSWVPEDGLYLPEEGTHDSYTAFKKRLDDDSRPTSYSPL